MRGGWNCRLKSRFSWNDMFRVEENLLNEDDALFMLKRVGVQSLSCSPSLKKNVLSNLFSLNGRRECFDDCKPGLWRISWFDRS